MTKIWIKALGRKNTMIIPPAIQKHANPPTRFMCNLRRLYYFAGAPITDMPAFILIYAPKNGICSCLLVFLYVCHDIVKINIVFSFFAFLSVIELIDKIRHHIQNFCEAVLIFHIDQLGAAVLDHKQGTGHRASCVRPYRRLRYLSFLPKMRLRLRRTIRRSAAG